MLSKFLQCGTWRYVLLKRVSSRALIILAEVSYVARRPKTATARHACVTGDLSTAEKLLTQYIHTDANDYTSYADRSFVMARQHDWDHAHDDAIKVSRLITAPLRKG